MRKKYDLGCAHLGNGISVYNRAHMRHGDYEKVAHIDADRKVTMYVKSPPKEVLDYIAAIANGPNPSVSVSQPERKVFRA